MAKLPTFVAGRFDLKVSMFVSGMILSNGPQVDPGYEGALLCLLYNANDSDYSLYPDKHFATIEFHTVVRATRAYRAQYQRARDFASFMAGSTAAGRGARLSERLTKVESDLGSYKMWFVGAFLAFIAIGIAILAYANDVASRLSDALPAPTDQRATTAAESATPAPPASKAPLTPAEPTGELGATPAHTPSPTPAKDRAKAP